MADAFSRDSAPGSRHGLAAKLHAAVDDVLDRYSSDRDHDLDDEDAEVLTCLDELEHSISETIPHGRRMLCVELSPAADDPAGRRGRHPGPDGPRYDRTVRIICGGDTRPEAGRVIRPTAPETRSVGLEVRVLPGLSTWLTVVDATAVVVPCDLDYPDDDVVVLRSPAIVAVAAWAFQQAWQAASPTPPPQELSALEGRILRCLSAGLKDEQAARRLKISVRTYRRRVTALCERLDASSRFEAGVTAAKRGLI